MTRTSWRLIFTIQLIICLCDSKLEPEEDDQDPIGTILENIIVVDVSKYLPQGYQLLRKEVSDIDGSVDQDEDDGVEVDESSNNTESFNKTATTNLGISGSRIFNSIYKGESLSPVLYNEINLESSSSTSPTQVTTTTTTTSTTTWRGPPPGTCYRGQLTCSLAGSVLVVTGLSWEEELAYPGTIVFQREADNLKRELGRVVQLGYFGTDLNFIDIEGFLNRSEGVLVDFYIEFRGFNHDVSTDDIGEAFKESLVPGEKKVKMFGNYGIDTSTSYFVVVDPLVPAKIIDVEEDDTGRSMGIPGWAWLVIFGGTISTLIIVMFGTIDGYRRYKKNSLVRGLHNTTVDALKDMMETTRNGSEVDLQRKKGASGRQGRNRGDIWTLQRIREQEEKRQQTLHHPSQDFHPPSGSCGGDSACDSLQEDTVVRKKEQKDVTEILKRGVRRASFKQSTKISNLNLLEESFESVSGDSDDQMKNDNRLVFI